jgi:hypothetical protein
LQCERSQLAEDQVQALEVTIESMAPPEEEGAAEGAGGVEEGGKGGAK